MDKVLFPQTFPVFVRFHQRAGGELGDPMDNSPETQPIDTSFILFAPGFERLPSTQDLLQGGLFENLDFGTDFRLPLHGVSRADSSNRFYNGYAHVYKNKLASDE